MARQTRKRVPALPMDLSTQETIHDWFHKMLEQVGYLILSKGKGYEFKIRSFKKSMRNLIKTIDLVKPEYTSVNRQRDLEVYRTKAQYVLEFIEKHF